MILESTVVGAAPLAETFAFPAIPRDEMWRIVIHSMAISSAPGAGAGATNILFELRPPGSLPSTQRIVLIDDAGPQDNLTQPCQILVPRQADGTNWIVVISATKAATMTVTIDFEKTILPASAA